MPGGINPTFSCSASCSNCPSSEACTTRPTIGLEGRSMVGGAILVFLLPLLLALSGALLLADSSLSQLLGGVSGFLLGVLTARVVVKLSKTIREGLEP